MKDNTSRAKKRAQLARLQISKREKIKTSTKSSKAFAGKLIEQGNLCIITFAPGCASSVSVTTTGYLSGYGCIQERVTEKA